MRTLCAAVLGFQSLVFALAIPVAIGVYGVDPARAGWIGGALAVGCLVVAALMSRPWAYALGWGLQAATFAAALVVPPLFVLAVVFTLLWWGAIRLGRKGDAAQAAFREEAARAQAAADAADDADGWESGRD